MDLQGGNGETRGFRKPLEQQLRQCGTAPPALLSLVPFALEVISSIK